MAKKGGMHINPAHKGKFTARHESVSEGLHSKSGLVRKEANFARMAKRHFEPIGKSHGTKADHFVRTGK